MEPIKKKRQPKTHDARGRVLELRLNTGVVVVDMINDGMSKLEGSERSLTGLARVIGYTYPNIWHVYNEYRKLPIQPFVNLCQMLGITDMDDVMRIFNEQKTPKNYVPGKSRAKPKP